MAGQRSETSAALWQVTLDVADLDAAEAAVTALDRGLATIGVFEDGAGGWRVEGMCLGRPDRATLEAMVELAWAGRDDAPPALAIARVVPRDWVAESQAGFPPLAVGRYFIHGSHWDGRVPAGRIGLLIDAATAFGTGEHATTRGCLIALGALARSRRFRRIVDMGTGTGILAMAAAKTFRREVIARDIDPESVRVARRNAAANGVAMLLKVARSDGWRDRELRRRAPFDLVFANILARPLMAMARDLAAVLAPGGVVVLSGLLARHERAVCAAHRAVGLVLLSRVAVDGWHTLVLARGARPFSHSMGAPRP